MKIIPRATRHAWIEARQDECCDKCVRALENDMTYEQHGLVFLLHRHKLLEFAEKCELATKQTVCGGYSFV